MKHLITLEGVYKSYRRGEVDIPVLQGVALEIERGELVALVGASGSGKSTLMNILGCLDRPTSGKYWLDGDEVSAFSADRRELLRSSRIGFVFQNFNLLARTSALENVLMPLNYTANQIPENERRQRAEKMLRLVGLGDRMDHEPSQMSGGEQQRVAIARSLINRPSVLTILVIIIGIGAVIAMMEIGRGSSHSIAQTISGLGANVIQIDPDDVVIGGVSSGGGGQVTLTAADADAMRVDCPAVRMVAPSVDCR